MLDVVLDELAAAGDLPAADDEGGGGDDGAMKVVADPPEPDLVF